MNILGGVVTQMTNTNNHEYNKDMNNIPLS